MASYASKQSTAIDYQRFAPTPEERAPELAVLPENETVRKKAPVRARIPYGKYALVAVGIFVVLAVIVFSYMKVAELTVQNDRLRSEISSLRSRENALIAKKEQLYTLSFVEEYAKSQLGMVKLDRGNVKYLELQNPERMLVSQPSEESNPSAIAALSKSFSAVLEYLN